MDNLSYESFAELFAPRKTLDKVPDSCANMDLSYTGCPCGRCHKISRMPETPMLLERLLPRDAPVGCCPLEYELNVKFLADFNKVCARTFLIINGYTPIVPHNYVCNCST